MRLLDLFPGLCTNEPWLVDALSLAMILASHCLPLVPTSKLNALPLHVRASHLVFNCKSQPRRQILGHHLRCCILSAFQSASFLDLLPTSITQKDGHKIYISVRALPLLYCCADSPYLLPRLAIHISSKCPLHPPRLPTLHVPRPAVKADRACAKHSDRVKIYIGAGRGQPDID